MKLKHFIYVTYIWEYTVQCMVHIWHPICHIHYQYIWHITVAYILPYTWVVTYMAEHIWNWNILYMLNDTCHIFFHMCWTYILCMPHISWHIWNVSISYMIYMLNMWIICGSYIFCHICHLSHIWQNICHFLYVAYMRVPYGVNWSENVHMTFNYRSTRSRLWVGPDATLKDPFVGSRRVKRYHIPLLGLISGL